MGDSQRISTPRSLRYPSFEWIPLRSPRPSPLESKKEMGYIWYTMADFHQALSARPREEWWGSRLSRAMVGGDMGAEGPGALPGPPVTFNRMQIGTLRRRWNPVAVPPIQFPELWIRADTITSRESDAPRFQNVSPRAGIKGGGRQGERLPNFRQKWPLPPFLALLYLLLNTASMFCFPSSSSRPL